jgi:hypothetical protein
MLVSIMAAADRVPALRRHGFAVAGDDIDGAATWIDARHPSGLRLVGHSPLLTAALCYWEDFQPQFAPSAERHARQQAAFQHAYQAVQAMGLAELGEPAMQGQDLDRFQHRWSAWRAGEVLVAVHQAAGDVQFGLSIQLDARRYPARATLEPRSPFIDWMWSVP